MKKRHLWALALCLSVLSPKTYAQDIAYSDSEDFELQLLESISVQKQVLLQGLDSLKKLSYVTDIYSAEDSLIADRIRKIQRNIPLGYNEQIRSYIDKYISRNYNPYMSKLRGMSQHYFPIYEQILAENNLPEEIKYISVVESSLDPHLVSRSGAVGLWQFMYPTAKIYNLTMDGEVDDRKDPYAASRAASRYFLDAYDEFNDWLLALASYNCGRGAVRRAIQRSGLHNPTFWELSPYLPQETRNYIPKFIAMTYAMKHAEEYGIGVGQTELAWEANPIMLDRPVDLRQIAAAVDLPVETIRKFNPAYKRLVVSASPENPKRLLLPQTPQLNDSLLYAALHNQLPMDKLPMAGEGQALAATNRYKVNRGETLASVSRKFGVSVQNLRAWNGLTARSTVVGRILIVKKEPTQLVSTNSKKQQPKTSSTRTAYVNYTVRKGDTLSGIAAKHKGSTVSQIKSDNGMRSTNLKVGQKLKIRKKA